MAHGVFRLDPIGSARAAAGGAVRSPHRGAGARHAPAAVAVEGVFTFRNARSALVLGQARGVALLVAARAGLPVFEYAPGDGEAGGGRGRGAAAKEAVSRAVCGFLGLAGGPEPTRPTRWRWRSATCTRRGSRVPLRRRGQPPRAAPSDCARRWRARRGRLVIAPLQRHGGREGRGRGGGRRPRRRLPGLPLARSPWPGSRRPASRCGCGSAPWCARTPSTSSASSTAVEEELFLLLTSVSARRPAAGADRALRPGGRASWPTRSRGGDVARLTRHPRRGQEDRRAAGAGAARTRCGCCRASAPPAPRARRDGPRADLVSALVNLGYKPAQAEEAARRRWRRPGRRGARALLREALRSAAQAARSGSLCCQARGKSALAPPKPRRPTRARSRPRCARATSTSTSASARSSRSCKSTSRRRGRAARRSTTASSPARPGWARPRWPTSSPPSWGWGCTSPAGPALEQKGDLAGLLTNLAAARRAVHRRDPPPHAAGRGVPLPGDGGLPARHHHRRRARGRGR